MYWKYIVLAVLLIPFHGSDADVIPGKCASGDIKHRQVPGDCRECTCINLFVMSYWSCKAEDCLPPAPLKQELQSSTPSAELNNALNASLNLLTSFKEQIKNLTAELKEKNKELQSLQTNSGGRRKRTLKGDVEQNGNKYDEKKRMELSKQVQDHFTALGGLVYESHNGIPNTVLDKPTSQDSEKSRITTKETIGITDKTTAEANVINKNPNKLKNCIQRACC